MPRVCSLRPCTSGCSLFIAGRLSKGFQQFGRYSRGFLTNEAVMIGGKPVHRYAS